MARPKRILCDRAVYHVTNRGHNRQVLFREDKDFIKFKGIIRSYIKKFDFRLFNYCLMRNHFHFLMQILKAKDLPLIMKGISQTFANYHRRKYRNVGYLFQARYKSFHIEKDEYLLECARYIERNPLRAKIVKELSEYPWSSYNYYAIGKKDDIITTNILYPTFGRTLEERRRNYIEYVSKPRPYEQLLDKAIASIK